MVTIYDLKPRFQALLRPFARGLVGAGATANGLTLAALAWNGDRRQLMAQLEECMAALLAELHPSSWE